MKDGILILGIGNTLLSDEGLGVRAVKMLLEEFRFPEGVSVVDGGTLGLDLLYHLEGVQRLIVLDAVLGGKAPGTLYRLSGEEVSAHFRNKVSAHEIGFQEVLAILELTERSPKEIVVLGLEPESLDPGTDLSPSVRESMPRLLEECLRQLRAWGVEPERRYRDAEEQSSADRTAERERLSSRETL